MPNVHLTASMEAYVQGQIRSGSYANVSEVWCGRGFAC